MLLESALLLFLVIDPFGNLPLVLGVTTGADQPRYRRIILRESLVAFGVLLVFALAGDPILAHLGVSQSSLAVAGGVILFIISLKMIFQTSAHIFQDDYGQDPLLVPIAVPALAGPSAMTTLMILGGSQQVPLPILVGALSLVFVVSTLVLLLGRGISGFLGLQGIKAMEKLFGLLLNLVSVNMILVGVKSFLAS